MNAYDKALAVLHEDTVAGWVETLADVNAEDLDDADYDDDVEAGDRECYQPDRRACSGSWKTRSCPGIDDGAASWKTGT